MSKSLICQTSGKLRYATRRQALDVRTSQRRRTKTAKEARFKIPKDCYRCEYCGDWHLSKHVPPAKIRQGFTRRAP